ncbi:morphogenic membrane protein MmpA [Streptomyces sp. NPDC055722]
MTTHRAPKSGSHPVEAVERAVTVSLLLAALAGLAWIGGMVYTLLEWPF